MSSVRFRLGILSSYSLLNSLRFPWHRGLISSDVHLKPSSSLQQIPDEPRPHGRHEAGPGTSRVSEEDVGGARVGPGVPSALQRATLPP